MFAVALSVFAIFIWIRRRHSDDGQSGSVAQSSFPNFAEFQNKQKQAKTIWRPFLPFLKLWGMGAPATPANSHLLFRHWRWSPCIRTRFGGHASFCFFFLRWFTCLPNQKQRRTLHSVFRCLAFWRLPSRSYMVTRLLPCGWFRHLSGTLPARCLSSSSISSAKLCRGRCRYLMPFYSHLPSWRWEMRSQAPETYQALVIRVALVAYWQTDMTNCFWQTLGHFPSVYKRATDQALLVTQSWATKLDSLNGSSSKTGIGLAWLS